MHCLLQTNVHDNYYSTARITESRLVWRDLDEFINGGISYSVSIYIRSRGAVLRIHCFQI